MNTKRKKTAFQRFRSFEEARKAQNLESYERGFDARRVKRLLENVPLKNLHHLEPALYRFSSFDEAHRFLREQKLKSS